MKKLYFLFVLAAVTLASCGRNYTCPVYSKASVRPAANETVFASVKIAPAETDANTR